MSSTYRSAMRAWKELRFLQLFIFSLFALLLQTISYESLLVTFAVSLLYLNVMYVAFSTAGVSKKMIHILLVFWMVVFSIKHFFIDTNPIVFVSYELLSIVLLIISATFIFRYILFSRKVTTDILFASMVNYLLIAVLFARIYATIEFLSPHSFSYSDSLLMTDGSLMSSHFAYFSLVTISTLGYGDIVPLHPLAQMLAAIEAIIGQFYVAMIVAWLVSMHVMHNSKNREEE